MNNQDIQEKKQALIEKLEQGIQSVFESERYMKYLSTISKFHNYSFRNSLLIMIQKPEASYVAGFNAWKKNFNRTVNKGEKGIQILAPSPYRVKVMADKIDTNTGNPILDSSGNPVQEETEITKPSFRPVYVFDISQTSGEPLPKLTTELKGNIRYYNEMLDSLKSISPFPIYFEDIPGSSKGYCNPAEAKIAIKNGMSEIQTIKTAIHEITHADLHSDLSPVSHDEKDCKTKEVEAESVAFIVCDHLGIDTADYSFAYIAGWSNGKELAELKNSLETIQKQANTLIDKIDSRFQELVSARENGLAAPDNSISITDMEQYGFHNDQKTDIDILPLKDQAINVFEKDLPVLLLYKNSIGITANSKEALQEHLNKGGIAGIKKQDWEAYQGFETTRKETEKSLDNALSTLKVSESLDKNASPADKHFYIYQLNDTAENRNRRFESYERLEQRGEQLDVDNYQEVYSGKIGPSVGLESIYQEFNINRPAGFTGHSLSVSDVVVIENNGSFSAHYVDTFGFQNCPQFAAEVRRHEEILDSVKFDNDIDLDKEKNRKQLGFKDNHKPISFSERAAAAKAAAAEQTGQKEANHETQKENRKSEER